MEKSNVLWRLKTRHKTCEIKGNSQQYFEKGNSKGKVFNFLSGYGLVLRSVSVVYIFRIYIVYCNAGAGEVAQSDYKVPAPR